MHGTSSLLFLGTYYLCCMIRLGELNLCRCVIYVMRVDDAIGWQPRYTAGVCTYSFFFEVFSGWCVAPRASILLRTF